MGAAPLSAWQYSTAKTIGKAIWKPYIASMAVVVILYITGTHSLLALFGYWLCALALFVTAYEFWRATWARHNAQNQNLLVALWQLIGKNRRRYGGYIIHLSMVFMALGVIGIESSRPKPRPQFHKVVRSAWDSTPSNLTLCRCLTPPWA